MMLPPFAAAADSIRVALVVVTASAAPLGRDNAEYGTTL
jgi:hypothetical protein